MRIGSLLLLILVAPAALAHGGPHGYGVFESGFAHPFTGIDHLATWLGLGAWLGCSAGWKLRGIPVLLPSLAVGALYWILHAVALPQASLLFQLGNAIATLALLGTGAWIGRRLSQQRALD